MLPVDTAPQVRRLHGLYAAHLAADTPYIEGPSMRIPPLPEDVPPSKRAPVPARAPRWWERVTWAVHLPWRGLCWYAAFNDKTWNLIAHGMWERTPERGSSTPTQPDVNPSESTDPNVRYAGEPGLRRFLADLNAGTIYP